MVKCVPMPTTPVDAMFQGPPIAYTPGSAKRLPPDDDAPSPEPAPKPAPPQLQQAIEACRARERAKCDPTHFDTAQIVAAQFEIDAVRLYGAWRLSTAIESSTRRT